MQVLFPLMNKTTKIALLSLKIAHSLNSAWVNLGLNFKPIIFYANPTDFKNGSVS